VLERIRGLDFPVEKKEKLLERIGDIVIKGVSGREIVEKIRYPVHSPAELLHEIREVIEGGG
jgi:predicted transcriptional regulator